LRWLEREIKFKKKNSKRKKKRKKKKKRLIAALLDQCRLDAFNKCKAVIKSCFPSAKVELYGSAATKLALPTSDLDISVVSGFEDSSESLYKLSPYLEKYGAKNLQVIAGCKVPVIKFVDPTYGFSLDITFGVSASSTVKKVLGWVSELDRLRPLTLIIKSLLHQRNLNVPYTGGLGSFSVVVMVRHFLLTLKDNKRGMTTTSPMGPLLLHFLRYFGRFNFQQLAVKHDGTTISKQETGIDQPFVVLNPLENSFVNAASSSFRMQEIMAMFICTEKALRMAMGKDYTLPDARFGSVLSNVCFVDPSVAAWRQTLVPPTKQRNPKNGKSFKKAHRVDMENSENALVQ
jgi:DNA polymerase sigma